MDKNFALSPRSLLARASTTPGSSEDALQEISGVSQHNEPQRKRRNRLDVIPIRARKAGAPHIRPAFRFCLRHIV
jgi:hypothetical protein